MKAWTVIILLAFVQIANAQIFWGDEYRKVEYQCAICGKSIYQNEKVEHSGWLRDNMGTGGSAWGYSDIADSVAVFGINFNVGTGRICKECLMRYNATIQDLMQKTWDNWLSNAMLENMKNRLMHDLERKKFTREEIERKIDELKAKRKALQ